MAYARPYPSLRSRILENESKVVTFQSRQSGIAKPKPQSFAERYRGTEYDTHFSIAPLSEPAVSRGRTMVIVVGAAVSGLLVVLLTAAPA